MGNRRGVQSTQIHACKVYTLNKAVHGFVHLAHGTYSCTEFSIYDTVQSARYMNLSLTVNPPTEISVSPDTVSSINRLPFQTVIYWLKLKLFILLISSIYPKCSSRHLIQVRYISLYYYEPVQLLLVGKQVCQLSQYSPLNFQIFC